MIQQAVRDAYRGRVFGQMGTTSSLLRLAGTLIAGALGGALGPTVLLTIQGGSYIAMGLLALAVLPGMLVRAGGDGEPAPAEPASAPEAS
jgi:hypothetical protein